MYESFFGLREPPFSLSPDPRFLWLSETHKEGLAALSYGIMTRTGFILLTGGVGTGKTTLLRAALSEVPTEFQTAFVTNTAGLSDLELLKLVAAELGIRERLIDRADCILAIKGHLLERARAGVRPILVIDEAQNLGPATLEQLRLLSNIETDREKLLQIVLSGQPELRRRFAERGLQPFAQRIVIDHQLDALRSYEARHYLEHRIRMAGGCYDQILRPGADSIFFAFSAGCPRLMSLLGDRVLLSAYSQGIRPVPRELVEAKAKQLEAVRWDELREAELWADRPPGL